MAFVTSGPVIALELMGVDCVRRWRQVLGMYMIRYNCFNIYSNVLIAPCSTADPGIAGAVLLQNKPNTKIERLIILD